MATGLEILLGETSQRATFETAEEGDTELTAGAAVGVTRTFGEGGSETGASMSLEGRVGWVVDAEVSGENRMPPLTADSIASNLDRVLRGDAPDLGEQRGSYQKTSLGIAARGEVALLPETERFNLHLGPYGRFQSVTLKRKEGLQVDAKAWEISGAIGPAIQSVVSTGEGNRTVGGFVTVGAGICFDEDCHSSVGANVTTVLLSGANAITAAATGRLVF